jgi:hypothetical protein
MSRLEDCPKDELSFPWFIARRLGYLFAGIAVVITTLALLSR